MPLPLAHTIVGYAVAAATGVRFRRETRTALGFSIVVANMPDFDFLPGALRNAPGLYHRTVAHTIPAGLLCALIIALVLTRLRGRFKEVFLLAFLVYGSHLVADMVNFGGANMGVQILWPLSDSWFAIKTPLAAHINSPLIYARGQGTSGFFADFAGFEFLRALILQGLLFAPVLLPAWWIRRRTLAARSRREI
jgi:membrane-bound metal-dependent hydrolase YbcI (DUF457 family)